MIESFPGCEKEKITKFPTIRVYPQHPMPTNDIDAEKFDLKQLKKSAGKYYQDKSIEITANNHKTFVEEDDRMYRQTLKVLLFTNDKKVTPFVYKVLS